MTLKFPLPGVSVLLAICLMLGACGSSSSSSDDNADSTRPTSAELSELVPPEIKDTGVLEIGTSLASAPFYFTTDQNKPTGIMVDMLEEAGSALGLKIEYVVTPFTGLAPALDSKKVDAIMSFSAIPENLEKYDIVPALQGNPALLIPKGNPKKIADLMSACGLKLSFTTGDAAGEDSGKHLAELCKEAGKPVPTISGYPTAAATETAVRSGTVDAQLLNSIAASYKEGSSDFFEAALVEEFGVEIPGIRQGVAFPKTSPEMGTALAAAFEAFQGDGTYDTILKKYSASTGEIDEPITLVEE